MQTVALGTWCVVIVTAQPVTFLSCAQEANENTENAVEI